MVVFKLIVRVEGAVFANSLQYGPFFYHLDCSIVLAMKFCYSLTLFKIGILVQAMRF